MKRITSSAVAIQLLALLVVVAVAAGACGAYVLLKDDNGGNGKKGGGSDDGGNDGRAWTYDSSGDPLIQGTMGIGTTFTYAITESKVKNVETGQITNFPANYNTIFAKIVGQSGSYYVVEIFYKNGSYDNHLFYGMIHKQTGQLRFSSNAGTDSFEFENKTLDLKKWEWLYVNEIPSWSASGGSGPDMELTYFGMQSGTILFSSDPDDAVPYKITVVSDYTIEYSKNSPEAIGSYVQTLCFEMISKQIETPKVYVPSGEIGKGMVFVSWDTYDWIGGKKYSMDASAICIADGDGELFLLLQATYDGAGTMMGFEPLPGTSLKDYFLEYSFGDDKYDLEGTETITTIDGSTLCNIYVHRDSRGYTTPIEYKTVVYAGPNNLPYLQKHYKNNVLMGEMTLVSYNI